MSIELKTAATLHRYADRVVDRSNHHAVNVLAVFPALLGHVATYADPGSIKVRQGTAEGASPPSPAIGLGPNRPRLSLLPARARQFDRNVPRGTYHDRVSIGGGAAYDRFQNQKELLRKHGRCLVCSVSCR
jgi:hypothetical protein